MIYHTTLVPVLHIYSERVAVDKEVQGGGRALTAKPLQNYTGELADRDMDRDMTKHTA